MHQDHLTRSGPPKSTQLHSPASPGAQLVLAELPHMEGIHQGIKEPFPLPSWYEPRPAPSTFPSHQLLEHVMQICAKESQQRTWETINICEKSPHKSTGRGIYGAFFGDFSGCSLLSHCACLHKYSSDSQVSAISYRLCKQEQHQAWDIQTPSCKDEGLAPHLVKE